MLFYFKKGKKFMGNGEHVFIEWIKNNNKISRKNGILEFGSGHCSTRKLNLAGYRVISIEHDKLYINLYSNDYIYAPLVNGWYDVSQIKITTDYDCILIDGPPGVNNNSRLGFLKHISMFNVNVPILIHDVERKAEKMLAEKISDIVKRKCVILDESIKVGQTACI